MKKLSEKTKNIIDILVCIAVVLGLGFLGIVGYKYSQQPTATLTPTETPAQVEYNVQLSLLSVQGCTVQVQVDTTPPLPGNQPTLLHLYFGDSMESVGNYHQTIQYTYQGSGDFNWYAILQVTGSPVTTAALDPVSVTNCGTVAADVTETPTSDTDQPTEIPTP